VADDQGAGTVGIGECHWADDGSWVPCIKCFALPDGGCDSTIGRLRSVIDKAMVESLDEHDLAVAVLDHLRALPVEQRMEAMGMEPFHPNPVMPFTAWREPMELPDFGEEAPRTYELVAIEEDFDVL
jgi:hypothetical protein